MLLTDINSIILKINNIDVNVIINFKTLENLYHFLKDDYLKRVIAIDCNDPFKFIEMIDDENEIDVLNYVSVLIFCMADGKISFSDIKFVTRSKVSSSDNCKRSIKACFVAKDKESRALFS